MKIGAMMGEVLAPALREGLRDEELIVQVTGSGDSLTLEARKVVEERSKDVIKAFVRSKQFDALITEAMRDFVKTVIAEEVDALVIESQERIKVAVRERFEAEVAATIRRQTEEAIRAVREKLR